jgi:short-subunit dehydrogenase
MARDLAAYGINVKAICPGILWTTFWQEMAATLVKVNRQCAGLIPRQLFNSRVQAVISLKREQSPRRSAG